MAAAYQGIPVLRNSLHSKNPIVLHRTSALANLQNRGFFAEWKLAAEELKRKLNVSSGDNKYENSGKNAPSITAREYNINDTDEISRKNIPSVTAERVVKGGREYNNDEDESLRASAKNSRPPPQTVPWQKELISKVHFIGIIGRPVEIRRLLSGGAYAWTRLGVKRRSQGEIMWFTLVFWDELAETAVQHLKKSDQVYVSGYICLQTTEGEDDKAQKIKVVATTLNFVEKRSPYSSQQVVVNKNTPYEDGSEQTVVNKDLPSGKNVQEDAANIESLWRAFFASPLEWWDHRKNKLNPRSPDFTQKETGEGLWIYSRLNPLWVKSQLAVLDSKMKGQGECERGGSSARSEGSLSSSQIYVSQDKYFEFPKGHPNSFGSDLAPLPTQEILAADPNLLDHHLILSSVSDDNKIDLKAIELQRRQQDRSKGH